MEESEQRGDVLQRHERYAIRLHQQHTFEQHRDDKVGHAPAELTSYLANRFAEKRTRTRDG